MDKTTMRAVDRETRLAEALRANLHKRKVQARERGQGGEGGTGLIAKGKQKP